MPKLRAGRRLIPIIDRLSGERVFRWIRSTSRNLKGTQRRGSIVWSSCQGAATFSIPENQTTFDISRRPSASNPFFKRPVLVDYVQPQLKGHTISVPTRFLFGSTTVLGRTVDMGSTSIGSQLGIIFNRPCSERGGRSAER
jgi:hypothetical protein